MNKDAFHLHIFSQNKIIKLYSDILSKYYSPSYKHNEQTMQMEGVFIYPLKVGRWKMVRYEEVLGRKFAVSTVFDNCNEFEAGMLERNHPRGMIKPEVYRIDNVKEYYFNITGRATFEDVLSRRPVEMNELKILFTALHQTLEDMKDYMIGTDIIVLDVRHIYFDEGEVRFIYDLSETRDFRTGLILLVRSILDRIEYSNKELVWKCYHIFDMVSCSQYEIDRIIKVLVDTEWCNELQEKGSHSEESKGYEDTGVQMTRSGVLYGAPKNKLIKKLKNYYNKKY